MTSNDFSFTEIDERAFAIFLIQGIDFFLDQDPQLRNGSIIDFCQRLWNRWQQMSNAERSPFHERAREELRRQRRGRRSDIYRSIMRDDTIDDENNDRNRRGRNIPREG